MKKETERKRSLQMLRQIVHTINFLDNLLKESKKNPLEEFLQKEIQRLKRMEEHIKENGKSY